MRARDRRRVETQIRDLCGDESQAVADRLVIIWARDLPDDWGIARVYWPRWVDLLICESRWRTASEEDRADTIAHELAHVIVWADDNDAIAHGAKWRRRFERLRSAALDLDW